MLRRIQWQTFLNPIAPWLLAGLVLWLCWQIAAVVWLLAAPPQPPLVRDVALQSRPNNVPNISTVQLFKIERPSLTDSAPMMMTPNVPMRLQGVMLSQPASRSSAMILMNGITDRYRVGQTIKDAQLQVASVRWDRVQLQRPDGTLLTLKFGEDSPLNPPAAAAELPAATPTTPTARVDLALTEAQSQLTSNPASYLTRMGLTATGQGYEVTAGAPANLRNQMGLRAGDRIVSINGQALGQPQNDAKLLEQIRQTRNAQIEIQRGEQTLTIQQSF